LEPLAIFAANIRRLREDAGLTQEALAEAADLHMTDIARFETARREPGALIVARLARGLGVDPGELFENVNP
jgi:transcriptional regulator with XRE-family HTH domain